MTRPFMEHPSNEDFESAVEAMADAIARLRALPEWKDWITFQAQGMGHRVDSYYFADIRMRGEVIKLEKPVAIDLAFVARRARVPQPYLTKIGPDTYALGRATPKQAARVLDVIFRHYLGIRPHPDDEGYVDLDEDDYAVSAEW